MGPGSPTGPHLTPLKQKVDTLNHRLSVKATDPEIVHQRIIEWITSIHRASKGQFAICSQASWKGRLFNCNNTGLAEAVEYIHHLSSSGTPGIYLRMTTVDPAKIGNEHGRGGAEASVSLPCLWADLDIAGPGHKHTPNHPNHPGYDPNKRIVHPLPADEQQALAILDAAALPTPTRLVHSGGGYYPIWQFTEPVDLTNPDQFTEAQQASENLQHLIGGIAERLGVHYGTGVSDLSRVLRIPGTRNRKVPDDQAWCRQLPHDGERRLFDFAEFTELVAALITEHGLDQQACQQPLSAAPKPPTTTPVSSNGQVWASANTPRGPISRGDDTPLNRLEEDLTWEQILEPAGWRLHHSDRDGTRHWTRPGKEVRDGESATTGHEPDRDRMYCFSDAAGLPVGECMTKGFVWAQLNHGGDLSAAAQAYGDIVRAREARDRIVLSREEVEQQVAAATASPADGDTPPTDGGDQPAGDWLPPKRSRRGTNLSAFPIEALPSSTRGVVEGVAAELQVDVSLVATYALGIAAALAAPRVTVFRTKRNWREQLSLFLLSALPPGERKSPAMRRILAPLRRIQRVMAQQRSEEIDLEICQLREGGETLKGASEANRVEDKIAELERAKADLPRILLAPDSTPEALADRLSRNDGSGAIIDSEGAIAGTWAGRYTGGKPTGLEVFLNPYDGDELSIDRVTRGSTTIRRPALSICCATQPDVFTKLARIDDLRNRGLHARVMWVFPTPACGTRLDEDTPLCSEDAHYRWSQALERIAEIPVPDQGVDFDDMPSLVLAPAAEDLFAAWRREVEVLMADDHHLEQMRDWASKHAGRTMRIAALLHLLDGGTLQQEISGGAMDAAIRIGRWSLEHAMHFFYDLTGLEEDATGEQCATLVRKARLSGKTGLTRRELRRLVSSRWTREQFNDAVDQLVELGYLRPAEFRDRGNRVREILLVNPLDAV